MVRGTLAKGPVRSLMALMGHDLQVHDHTNAPKDQYVVAVDAVGAGPGDLVLYATGSSARQTTITKDKPCDAVVMAIVDSWDVGGENVYEKWSD